MKIFLFKGAEQVTTSYHSGGSVMFVAEDKYQVLYIKPEDVILSPEDWDNVKVWDLDDSYEGGTPRVFVFPDAGCC